MRNIFILFLLITWSSLFSQEVCTLSDQAINTNYYGGSDFDSFFDITFVEDGNILCFGLSYSQNGQVSNPIGDKNWWVVKTNQFGELLWEKSFNADGVSFSYNYFFSDIMEDGNYLIAGRKFEMVESGITENYFGVAKINKEGDIIWEKKYDLKVIGDFKSTSDGGFIIISDEILLTKFDKDGNMSWQKNYPIEAVSKRETLNLTETPEGDFVFTASVEEAQLSPWYGSTDIWIVKISSSGETIWERIIGGSSSDSPYEVIVSNQEIIVLGLTFSNNIDFNYIDCLDVPTSFAIKFNMDGDMLWTSCFSGLFYISQSNYRSFTYATDGGFMIGLHEFGNDGEFIKRFDCHPETDNSVCPNLNILPVFGEGSKKKDNKIVFYGGIDTGDLQSGFGVTDCFLSIIDISDLETTNVNNVNNFNINLSPNPVQNIINLNGSLESFKNYSVFSLNGIKQNSGVLNSKSIDVRNLQAGVYILSLYSENNRRSIRFIKQ